MELINYPIPRRKRCAANDGDTAVAAISIVHSERGRSLIRPVSRRRGSLSFDGWLLR